MNACVAFTGFYLISKIYHSFLFSSSYARSILMGGLAGMIGLFLMMNAVEVNDDVRIDLRHLPAILLAFYGARLPLFIATGIIASSRLLFGLSDQAIIAFIGTFVVGLGMLWIHRRFADQMFLQVMALNIWALSMLSFGLLLNLGWGGTYVSLIMTLWMVGLIAGLLASALTIDLERTTRRAKEYQRSAERDHLTGLFNRRVWERSTEPLGAISRSYHVMILDIDHFKRVNDVYGHANGDLVLKRFAELLISETRPQDVVARLGGEEFAILIHDLPVTKANKIAERIRANVETESFFLNGFEPIHITVSIGIAHAKACPVVVATEAADNALYEAKHGGRNRVVSTGVTNEQFGTA